VPGTRTKPKQMVISWYQLPALQERMTTCNIHVCMLPMHLYHHTTMICHLTQEVSFMFMNSSGTRFMILFHDI
jgi:hypothetical protein